MKRDKQDSRLLRAAQRIHDHLVTALRQVPHLPEVTWQDILDGQRRLVLAEQRGWRVAASRVRYDLQCTTTLFLRQLEEFRKQLPGPSSTGRILSAGEIFQELRALFEEFDEVELDLTNSTLSVMTEEIQFGEVDLGRFSIVLDWNNLAFPSAYSVVAQTPNPASTDESTTHPHVHDEGLCEGEGRTAIRQALSQGRLYDFFLLVRQTLRTYNPSGAYVSIDRWHGVDCQDCGCSVSNDDSMMCERCEHIVCTDCISECRSCARTCCGSCTLCCTGCDAVRCISCSEECRSCRRAFCEECLNQRQCTDCRSEEDQPDEDLQPGETVPESLESAVAPIQPVCLGQAAIPA